MSNVTQIPDPPKLKVLGCFLSQLPPMIARKEVKYFTAVPSAPRASLTMTIWGMAPSSA